MGSNKKSIPTLTCGHIGLLLLATVCGIFASPMKASALSLSDYFSYTLTAQLSTTQVTGSSQFLAHVSGQVTCVNGLPSVTGGAYITGRVVAELGAGGAQVVLNPAYTVNFNSVPTKQGQSAQDSVDVPLSFPADSPSGNYSVVGQLVQAKAQTLGIWIDVTSYVPASYTIGSVSYSAASSGGGNGVGPGGQSGGGQAPPGISLTRLVDQSGKFLVDSEWKSEDNKCGLTIKKGTDALTSSGRPLTQITIMKTEKAPPPEAGIIGTAYDFGPQGTTFDQPVIISFYYNTSQVPAGLAEKQLCLGYWDESSGHWVKLTSNVDTSQESVSAQVDHFSVYALLAPSRPASISLESLSINPAKAAPGQSTAVTVRATNAGDLAGDYRAVLQVDGQAVDAQTMSIPGDESGASVFVISVGSPGTHQVTVGNLSGTIVVSATEEPTPAPATASFSVAHLSISPSEAEVGGEFIVTLEATNSSNLAGSYPVTCEVDGVALQTMKIPLAGGATERVAFTIAAKTVGTHTVEVNGLDGTYLVRPASSNNAKIWPWVAGVVGAVLVTGLLAGRLYRRASK